MRSETVRIAARHVRRRALGNVLVGSGFVAVLFGVFLYNSVTWSMGRYGLSLGEALFRDETRPTTIVATVSWIVLICAIVSMVAGSPRRNTVQEVRVGPDGVELCSEAKWWYRGTRTLLEWDNIQVISAQHTVVREARGRSTQRVAREVLDFYLYRDVGGLPFFATAKTVTEPPVDGVEPPAQRVRVGGRAGEELAASVQAVAPVLGEIRPDLFYQGVAVDQWFAPTPPMTEALAAEETADGHAPREASGENVAPLPTPRPDGGYALPTDLWLDFRPPLMHTVGALVGLPALAAVTFLGVVRLNETEGGVLLGLLGLVLVAIFLLGLIGAITSVIALPVSLARCGIRLDAEGLELVEKRGLLQGLDRRRIPWDDVQAIVARGSAAMDEHGLRRAQKKTATDVYLRVNDGGFQRPGTGLSLEVTAQSRPTSAYLGTLATFPALRLRFPHVPAAERRSAGQWDAVRSGAPGPHTLPGAQLRAALLAARPDLCHGFGVSASVDG
ncbi:hypothetical protein J4H86_22515 [Spiractinospora alimapuensis]|uniref:hypothetical protein n=1 Tax=Spiractinospora alimapuensis TaxID=2820884 RepID=UPI001F29F490|nr:hypothetical protein [Spiractinospora alimapuensis]QVQ51535.1 hypothetical protein J4H86_22515 [Spiractinospora alimapuensis]